MENNINIDAWRLLRNAQRREDDAVIDMLCAALAAKDKRIAELEESAKGRDKDAAG